MCSVQCTPKKYVLKTVKVARDIENHRRKLYVKCMKSVCTVCVKCVCTVFVKCVYSVCTVCVKCM